MIDMTTSLRHLRWADALLFHTLGDMPVSALAVPCDSTGRTVAHLLQHIVNGGEWYRFCLTGAMWTDVLLPAGPEDLAAMAAHLDSMNALLIEQGTMNDEVLSLEDESGPVTISRSALLSQACYHSTEHRTQIASALTLAGVPGLDLDMFDLWHMGSAIGW